ncbi:MAG TPA: F0F1 ATP synthase subunit A [Nitrolancea sp.]|jgi:F-type H+-transporting ATPase subunit a|nr:F0F1 ATP synthase subunit A [Nitrolancea sp.]
MNVHVEVAPQALWHIPIPGTNYEFPVTNTFFMMLIVMVLLIVVGAFVARRATLVPTRGQGAVEIIVEFLLGLVEGAAGKKLGRNIFPIIGGLFIFILFCNYVELLPGLGSLYLNRTVGGQHVHLEIIRPPTSDLNMTIAMALLSWVMFQYLGIKAHGFRGRIKHLATPVFVFPIEVISETARIVSLSFRLFGNIFAGDVLLTIMYSIAVAIKVTVIGFLVPVVFLYLEVLFGFIQALVFAILTLIYISLAAADVHDDHVEESFEQESGVRTHHAVAPAAAGD